MSATKLPDSRKEAFDMAMETFLDIDVRLGSDNPEYPGMERMMMGYSGFVERVVGDAFNKIDTTLLRDAELAEESATIDIGGATLSNIRHASDAEGKTKHVATVLSNDGTPEFRIEWDHRKPAPDGTAVIDIRLCTCPADDPEYSWSERFASAVVSRENAAKGSHGTGFMSFANSAKLVAALDLLRPYVTTRLDRMDHGKPTNSLGLSFSQLNMIQYQPLVDFDGGLAGRLFLEVSDTMTAMGAARAFRFLSQRIEQTAKRLDEAGARYGDGCASLRDGDYSACVLPGDDHTSHAILMTQPGLFFDHNTFLAFNTTEKDGRIVSTTIVPIRGGDETVEAMQAFISGNRTFEIAGTYDHGTSRTEMSRLFVETSSIAVAPFNVDYALECLDNGNFEITPFSEFAEMHGFDPEAGNPAVLKSSRPALT